MTATVSYTPPLGHRPFSSGAELPPLTAVLDPQTTPVSAAWLMAPASDPLRTSTTGRLMAEAAHLRTVSESDRAVQAVWDAEGGHEARASTARPRIPAVTAPVIVVPAAAPAMPDPARGV
ncbi:hypothetical protein ACH4TV_35215 [Streptomyces sp. NPDC020898]|uniref:hypothetical protein n=1 Tax=Streptomyces sp. NPDC020898 TaxID=3365101 RepID=UPI00378A03FB